MTPAALLTSVGFWVLAALVLVGAVIVVTYGNLFRAALCLGVVLAGVAGLFVLLEAEFLAFVQILVYVGAILTLVVFAIMLTARSHKGSLSRPLAAQLPAAAVSVALFVVLAGVSQVLATGTGAAGERITTAQLGEEFVTSLALPFEVVSLVFVAAMVGAIAVAFAHPPRASSSRASPATQS
ncbi:MAG: NADH-quinone oxidoreductase subunit J [Candidatus Omnitrophica bacterium]|nr:NADH-quinone oxidoreductase subunit J [Candidatus Omnitrophota bacterium]